MSLELEIRKAALLNAVQFEGKATEKAIAGKILGSFPEARKNTAETMKLITQLVSEVNALGLEKQKAEMEKLGIVVEKKKIDDTPKFPDLPESVAKNVVSLFPPEPSKYPHIGHTKAAFINHHYAKKYNGKFVLRFEDNNPELAKQEYVDALMDALKWLGLQWDVVDYVSDHIDEFYTITEKLIDEGHIYLCTCDRETTSKLRFKGLPCEHRETDPVVNKQLWKEMLAGNFKEGAITARLKIDIAHQNTTMRDPSILRIDTNPHFRVGTKYKVWPLYDYATSVMDKFEGITFRVRTKEFEMRAELQDHIRKLVGIPIPYVDEIARFNLEGVEASGRKIREMIQKGEMTGWDDPRLVTVMALRKRGYTPEGIKDFLLSTGMSKSEATISWDVINSANRKVIDSIAYRFFFVDDPVEISLKNTTAEDKAAEIPSPLEIQKPRKIAAGKSIIVSKSDFVQLQGKHVRLRYLVDGTLNMHFSEGTVPERTQVIQWVPANDNVPVKVIMPDASEKEGYAEKNILEKIGSIVQFERFGFVKLYKEGNNIIAYFTHK